MKSVLALVLIVCTIIAEGQVCVQVKWSEVNVRSSPCGSVVGNLGNGRKTTLRRGAYPTTCTLGGTSYDFVAISDYNGWVASDSLQFCSSQCVRVDADSVNVRSSPCGSVATQYKRNQQKTLTGTALRVAACAGKKYIWAPTADGLLVTEYLRQCTASTPSPSPGNCNSRTKPARIGNGGLNVIKKWEGLRRCWYRDPVGYPTICYGHLIKSGDPYRQGTCLTTDQCTDLLRRDLPNYESCVKRYITVGLNQNQFDALVSFTFNLGCGSLQGSTLRKRLNRGEYSAVCTELKKWVYAGGRVLQGLVKRRNDECNLFRSCSGVARTGSARYCPAADECSACILNSQDQILDNYDLIGMNTTCGAESWKTLADDYCNVVDPWDCYYKGPAGAINGTTVCPSCNFTEPTFPELPGEESNCINTGGNYCDPESDDCETLMEGSKCDEFTGSCLLPSANETFSNATYVPCEPAPEEEYSGASPSFLVVGMIASLLAVLLNL